MEISQKGHKSERKNVPLVWKEIKPKRRKSRNNSQGNNVRIRVSQTGSRGESDSGISRDIANISQDISFILRFLR